MKHPVLFHTNIPLHNPHLAQNIAKDFTKYEFVFIHPPHSVSTPPQPLILGLKNHKYFAGAAFTVTWVRPRRFIYIQYCFYVDCPSSSVV
jgi:hypothetical protein